mgnify:CR=1 FL=1
MEWKVVLFSLLHKYENWINTNNRKAGRKIYNQNLTKVKTEIDGLTSILEPVMLVVMGIVVALIVVAVLVPIFEMSNVAG